MQSWVESSANALIMLIVCDGEHSNSYHCVCQFEIENVLHEFDIKQIWVFRARIGLS